MATVTQKNFFKLQIPFVFFLLDFFYIYLLFTILNFILKKDMEVLNMANLCYSNPFQICEGK